MKLTARVTRRIEDIPQEDWDSVFPPVLEGYGFFKSLDESKLEQFSFYYIVVYDGDSVMGAAPCFSMRYSLDTSINGGARWLLNRVKRLAPNIFSVRALICGIPMGQGNIGVAGGRAEVFKAILGKMEEIAKNEKIPVIAFKDFSESYARILGILPGEKFARIESLPYAEMDITFGDFEAYLKKLSGATRYDLRRKFKKVDGRANITMEVIDNPDEKAITDMHGLYMQIVNRHEMGFEVMPEGFFASIAKNMGGRAKFFLWRVDGEPAAFLFALTSKDLFIDYYLGLDYRFAHEYHLFFVKFRDVMNWCMDNGIKKYEMGISGYEAKRRLGFDFTPLRIYAKHRNPAINPAFKVLCHFLKFENFDPDLKAIKRRECEKGRYYPEGVRADNAERRAGQRGPAMHEEGAVRDGD